MKDKRPEEEPEEEDLRAFGGVDPDDAANRPKEKKPRIRLVKIDGKL